MSEKKDDAWRVWDAEKTYGEVLFKRATGESPEMESSKAAAKHLKNVVKPNDKILDVGCGAGHYLKSLNNTLSVDFTYTGVDATQYYVDLAKKAFKDQTNASFVKGDIFNLPFESKSQDVVMCCNVFLHLPSINKPIHELCRVAKRYVLIRSMIGNRSFRIKDVHDNQGDDFEDNGEPKSFHFYNIYGEKYIRHLLKDVNVKSVEIIPDTDYKAENLTSAIQEQKHAPDVTTMLGNWQVNGYILQPWAFIKIELNEE